MKQEAIQNIKNYWKFRTLFPEIEDYTEHIIIKPEGIIKMLDSSIGPILLSKNITKDGIKDFIKTLYETVEEDEIYPMINLIANPPFELYQNLNKVINFKEKFRGENYIEIYNKTLDWLATHKFPGGANVGSFEAFLITMFKDMDNSSIGDVRYNGIDLIEVKGSGGRLRGQYGYNNGIITLIQELMIKLNYELPTNYLHYNIGKDTINSYRSKILWKESEMVTEHRKYNKKLADKKLRMQEASGNKETKKYKNAKEQYEKYKITTPKSYLTLQEDIKKYEQDIKNCALENISKDLAKKSLDDSVDFLLKIFARKYSNSDDSKIEKFIRKGINEDGSFSEKFQKEYFIFEFEYYQFLEKFKYFCLFNLKESLMLIIDSPEKFREFVESGNIVIKSSPSFSEHAGQQGMVFALELKR